MQLFCRMIWLGKNRIECEIPQIYLFDGNENVDKDVEKGVVFVDKYQEVNKIVDEILKQIGEEIKSQWGVKQNYRFLQYIRGRK